MKFKIFLTVTTLLLVHLHISADVNADLESYFTIYTDSPQMDSLGYNNCDMNTNGELNVMKLIKKNNLVFDIGSHIGEWSLNLLKFEHKISIFAFEPVPILFDELRKNLCNYNVSLNLIALSNVKGEATFVYYPKHPGLSTLHQRPEIEKLLEMEPVFINVATERLDTLCNENDIKEIDFIKIDTEGNEFYVLSGAEELLKNKAITYIQFEYGGCYLDSKTNLKQVYDLLTCYNYRIYRILSDGLIAITEWRPELENYAYSNYLAVRQE